MLGQKKQGDQEKQGNVDQKRICSFVLLFPPSSKWGRSRAGQPEDPVGDLVLDLAQQTEELEEDVVVPGEEDRRWREKEEEGDSTGRDCLALHDDVGARCGLLRREGEDCHTPEEEKVDCHGLGQEVQGRTGETKMVCIFIYFHVVYYCFKSSLLP